MAHITESSTLAEVASLVSQALSDGGIAATLSGGSAVSIYTHNKYLSHDLDFVTAAIVAELEPILKPLGFVRTGRPRLSQFEHPLIDWFIEFPPAPIAFGHLQVEHKDCAVIDLPTGQLRIISPTQSVMDRLAAAFAWNDPQSREQAVMVAVDQEIEWDTLKEWFRGEGLSDDEFMRFKNSVDKRRNHGDKELE